MFKRSKRLKELEAAKRRVVQSWNRAVNVVEEDDDWSVGYAAGLSVALGHLAPEMARHPVTNRKLRL